MPESHYEQELSNWAFHFKDRFPTWLDSRFTKGLHALLGVAHPSFLSKSSLSHLKRLLFIQFFLQKKIEAQLKQEDTAHLCVNIFSIDSRLCISIAASNAQHTLANHAILQVASQKIPALMEVPHSCYQWTSSSFPYTFFYIELDKMRGQDLSLTEVKEIETYLSSHLSPYTNKPSIFWPYNHEDAFKHILTLGKEVTKEDDYPQVMIHFQKQTADHLEFLILLARPEQTMNEKTTLTSDRFPPSVRFIFRLKHTLATTFPILAEAFSLELPSERFKVGTTTNLLHAREFVAKLLQDVIGTFRDYNGGLFEIQKKHYQQLEEEFSQKIPTFSLFGKELFYSLTPAEAPLCLDSPLWKELLKAFSHALSKKTPFSTKKTKHILILKSKDPERLTSYLEKAKKLQEEGKLTAYAHLKVGLEHYLVFIDEVGNDIATIKAHLPKQYASMQNHRTLHILFKGELPVSLHIYYLSQELRGRTLSRFLYEGLVCFNSYNQIEYSGCENISISKDNTCYTFKLLPHVWSNGDKVTAFHYEKSWKKNFLKLTNFDLFYVLKNAFSIKKGKKPLQSLGVCALDEDTLQVNLEKADPLFLKKLTHPLFFPCFTNIKGLNHFNGPYQISQIKKEQIILEKNFYYWNKNSIFFENVNIQCGKHFEIKCNKYKNNSSYYFLDFPKNPDLKFKRQKILRSFSLYLNTQHKPLEPISLMEI